MWRWYLRGLSPFTRVCWVNCTEDLVHCCCHAVPPNRDLQAAAAGVLIIRVLGWFGKCMGHFVGSCGVQGGFNIRQFQKGGQCVDGMLASLRFCCARDAYVCTVPST